MNIENICFSILILSIPERFKKLENLVIEFTRQINNLPTNEKNRVEVLVDLDNGIRSIAEKRNNLLRTASGRYICFIDDDDLVSTDFVEQIYSAILSNPNTDCITFNQSCDVDGAIFNVEFGLGNPLTSEFHAIDKESKVLKRPPYHMCVFKSKIAKLFKFKDGTNSRGKSIEDIEWLTRLYPALTTETKINKILHFYIYREKDSKS